MRPKQVIFHRLKAAEGGASLSYALWLLKAHGVPARRTESALVGHWAVAVDRNFQKKASWLLKSL